MHRPNAHAGGSGVVLPAAARRPLPAAPPAGAGAPASEEPEGPGVRAIPAGATATHRLVVSEAMTVDFEDRDDPRMGRLHPVYATYWLVKHLELVSRKLLLPYLEPDEEAIGHEVHVTHLASALPGMRVTLTARLRAVRGTRLDAACEAVSELGQTIGRGHTTQVVLPHARLEQGFERLASRWERARAGLPSDDGSAP